MVHRPPDSRLLTNLIAHEKEYTKHFNALFPVSHSTLASLSAYAAASPSTNLNSHSASPAQLLTTFTDILASADDALQRYAEAAEKWREALIKLKELEDDVGAVIRDREILVTRLIKLSKSTKPTRDRDSRPLSFNASASHASLPSIASSNTHNKLVQAQAELQACETHLAAKEQELELARVTTVRDGLGARCRALIDCGWAWREMGTNGLRTLGVLSTETDNNEANGQGPGYESMSAALPSHSRTPSTQSHPRQKLPALPPFSPSQPNPASYVSDNSSLTPSQSASQGFSRDTSNEGPYDDHSRASEDDAARDQGKDNDVTITVPPAHSISELTMPTGVRSPSPTSPNLPASRSDPGSRPRKRRSTQRRRPISRGIQEVSDEDGEAIPGSYFPPTAAESHVPARLPRVSGEGSSTEEDPNDIVIVDNQPFGQSKRISVQQPSDTPKVDNKAKGKQRERKPSMTFFGSIRGLFKSSAPKDSPKAEWDGIASADSPTDKSKKDGKKRRWATRTDRNLKSQGRESSDSEDDARHPPPLPITSKGKLRKGRSPPSTPTITSPASGWVTDGPTVTSPRNSVRKRKKASTELIGNGISGGHTDGELDDGDITPRQTPSKVFRSSVTKNMISSPSPLLSPASSISRASVTSAPAASTPATSKRNRRVTADFSAIASGSQGGRNDMSSSGFKTGNPPRRAASVTYGSPARFDDATPKGKRGKRSGTVHPNPTNGNTSISLMSIVEDVARQNRQGWADSSPSAVDGLPAASSSRLEVPKAPIPGVPSRGGPKSDFANGIPMRTGSLDLPRAPGSAILVTRQSSTPPPSPPPGNQSSTTTTPSASNLGDPPRQASRPAKSPLRSALRNGSRTPSPSPGQLAEMRPQEHNNRNGVTADNNGGDRPRGRTPERERVPSRLKVHANADRTSKISDTTSISSYETGREYFDEEPSPRDADEGAGTASTVSTEVQAQPARRKSVRVSLQPTFSPTPPALDDDDERDGYIGKRSGKHAPWNRDGYNVGNGDAVEAEAKDMWEDSSEEDEEYSRARKLLSRPGKTTKNKGQG
ncbi:hypothetical protein BJ138DRAFT_1073592 [Hygrophoropsis aurantiaca]|uniref:Uncharacterized protein n=1 Tax=Hygrophoropsis aurantiaca TaxID=72124 RepID=A0ACB7ZTT2_9AGAM|nr:hypothetical protein BJ138DRAFT_1073592 [Hygrophoropsis aurantiaca]